MVAMPWRWGDPEVHLGDRRLHLNGSIVSVAGDDVAAFTPKPRKVLLLQIGAGSLPVVTPPVRTAAAWFPVPYTAPDFEAPTGLATIVTPGGVRITWDAMDGANIAYQLQRALDVDGEPGAWSVAYLGEQTAFSSSEAAPTWWRVRVLVRGLAGPWSEAVPASFSVSAVTQQAVIYLYKRAASEPALPSAAVTYTFANGGVVGVNNGWSLAVPGTNGQPLWVTSAAAISDETTDTIDPDDWSAPVIMAQDGADGDDGDPGNDGFNVTRVFLFKRAASSPALPSADVTFTFATGGLTGVDNGWTNSIPGGSNPLWVTTASAISNASTDVIPAGEWTAPVVMAVDGAAGLNVAKIALYKRAASTPGVPSVDVTYTFADGSLASVNNGWTATVPGADGNPLWVTEATAISTGTTDTIGTTEWSAPVVMAQDGTDGDDGDPGNDGLNSATIFLYQRAGAAPSVPSSTVTFTFASSGLSGVNNGWSANIPAGTDPIWVTTATAVAAGTTDTIATGEWSAPQILARNGEVFIARGNTVVAGSTAVKVGGVPAWDSDVISAFGFTSCHVSWKPSQANAHIMVGLAQNAAGSTGYATIDFAWYQVNDGTLQIYESGTSIGTFGTYTASTALAVTYDQTGTITYWVDRVAIRTVSAPGLILYADSSFYSVGGAINGLQFGPGEVVPASGTTDIEPGAVTEPYLASAAGPFTQNASLFAIRTSITIGPYPHDVDTNVFTFCEALYNRGGTGYATVFGMFISLDTSGGLTLFLNPSVRLDNSTTAGTYRQIVFASGGETLPAGTTRTYYVQTLSTAAVVGDTSQFQNVGISVTVSKR